MSDTGSTSAQLPTPEEIEALIATVGASQPVTPGSRRSGPQPFDFRRPNKFSRDHIRTLQIVNETFARQFGTILSTTIRSVSSVSLSTVGQLTYDEFVASTPNPTMLAILSLEPLNGAGLLYIPIPLAMAAIDRLLGGSGTGPWPTRPLTEIEATLMRNILDRVLAELTYAYESLVELEPKIVGMEYNPQFAQVAAPSDMMVVTAFDARIGTEMGGIGLCIPFSSLQPILERATAHTVFVDRTVSDPAAVQHAVGNRLEQAPVEVSIRFNPVTLTSRDIVELREGDVLPLRHRVDEALTVSVADRPYLKAKPGKKGKRLAVLISEPTRSPE